MTNKKFTETELENAVVELFTVEGYQHIDGKNLQGNQVLLLDDLRNFILNRYSTENLTEIELQKIINKLSLINSTPLYDGNREAFFLVNEGFNLQRDDISKIALHIDFIDFDSLEKNNFKVVTQFSVQDENSRRPDLLLFINGIPIAIFEFKSAIREDTTIFDAWQQIHFRYCRDIPKLLRYNFLAVISDGVNTKLGTIFSPYENFYSWNKINDAEKVSDGISSLFTCIKGAFSKSRILQILRDFIFYPDTSDKNSAIVCRYPQFFGATKMFDNIKKHLKPSGDGKGGTYFGATGCGKTFTMLFLSRLITQRHQDIFKNPTIIILVDREDLDRQTSKLFVNAKKFLGENDVRSIESRNDLQSTLKNRPSGGIYIMTIQKFCEEIGLLSNRSNIVCFSDEAHRTQTNINSKLKHTDEGIFTSYGFAHYLRESFPNATYCGFTGTPIDETLAVFGNVVDRYTMKQSCEDGITVRIVYEPRLARVLLSDSQAKEIEEYYKQCEIEGSTTAQIEKSKRAMAKISAILAHPDRLKKLATDIVEHYEKLCNEKPKVVQKAMIVCSDRKIAFKLLQEIISVRPDWNIPKKADNEKNLSQHLLKQLSPLAKINLVATRGQNDTPELFELCGTKEYRQKLAEQFKNDFSNFKIAVVVDMWITGFDVPSLAVMYIDKPLQKHTLIQTISRVNRIFDGKDKGLIVDYIGFKDDMLAAVKKYGDSDEAQVDELDISLKIFRKLLSFISKLFSTFDSTKFYSGSPLERLNCLNFAADFIQLSKDNTDTFMQLSKKLKAAFAICFPSGSLTELEIQQSQFFLAIRAIIFKQIRGNAPDSEVMNSTVEKMVQDALTCSGIEHIIDQNKSINLFSDNFTKELNDVDLPISKFNALLKLLKKTVADYSHENKIKSVAFDKRLKKIVDAYNNRDNFSFSNSAVSDFVNELSNKLLTIWQDVESDKNSHSSLGISIEEKTFFDILVQVRNDHNFSYSDEQCLNLAKSIKSLVDSYSKYDAWTTRNEIITNFNMELSILLYKNHYPPEWKDEVFDKLLAQSST